MLKSCAFKNSSTSKAIISKHGFAVARADSSLRENCDELFIVQGLPYFLLPIARHCSSSAITSYIMS